MSLSTWSRRAAIAVGTLAALCVASVAHADPKEECVLAHAGGQRDMQAGHLSAARDKFTQCARDVCPAPVANDCTTFLEAAERAQPTVVLGAHDGDRRDVTDVQVLLDGAPFATSVGPRAVAVDPGDHVFRFVDRAGVSVEVHAVVREGEKERVVLADFPRALVRLPPAPPPAETPLRPWARPAGFAIGGVGLAATGVFAAFGISAAIKAHDLEACAPNCNTQIEDVHAMRTQAMVADIALVGGAVLVSTAVVFLILGSAKAPPPAAGAAPRKAALLSATF